MECIQLEPTTKTAQTHNQRHTHNKLGAELKLTNEDRCNERRFVHLACDQGHPAKKEQCIIQVKQHKQGRTQAVSNRRGIR